MNVENFADEKAASKQTALSSDAQTNSAILPSKEPAPLPKVQDAQTAAPPTINLAQ